MLEPGPVARDHLGPHTGELAEGALLVPCKDRRASVCPSCSRLYQADAWQLVAAGIRGGKGVDPGVVGHPQLFVTLTAPSFGAVHRGPRASGIAQVCRPRRKTTSCPHGRSLACFARHGADDPLVGEPLCAECFDYRGAVLWNAHVPRARGPGRPIASTERWPGPAAWDLEICGRSPGSPT